MFLIYSQARFPVETYASTQVRGLVSVPFQDLYAEENEEDDYLFGEVRVSFEIQSASWYRVDSSLAKTLKMSLILRHWISQSPAPNHNERKMSLNTLRIVFLIYECCKRVHFLKCVECHSIDRIEKTMSK